MSIEMKSQTEMHYIWNAKLTYIQMFVPRYKWFLPRYKYLNLGTNIYTYLQMICT